MSQVIGGGVLNHNQRFICDIMFSFLNDQTSTYKPINSFVEVFPFAFVFFDIPINNVSKKTINTIYAQESTEQVLSKQ